MSFATSMAVGGVIGATFKFAPTLINITRRSAQQIIASRASSSAWSLGWSARGFALEHQVFGRAASVMGQSQKSFSDIDDLTNGYATSIKSLDLTAATYRNNPNAIASTIRSYARKLQEFTGKLPITSNGISVAAGDVKHIGLVMAFENGAANAAQAKVIAKVIKNFKSEFPGLHIATAWTK